MPNPKGIRKARQDIYTVNFADYLPGALKHDLKIRAIAEAMTKELLTVSGENENVLIYSRIDELPETLLDILAYDMHVDWYNYAHSLEDKRKLIKTSVKVHKKLGTVYAVETAIKLLHGNSKVEEWFDYGGTPFCFRLILDLDNNKLKTSIEEIINRVYMTKRLSAHFESVVLRKSFFGRWFLGTAQTYLVKTSVKVQKYNKKVHKTVNVSIGIARLERVIIDVPIKRTSIK